MGMTDFNVSVTVKAPASFPIFMEALAKWQRVKAELLDLGNKIQKPHQGNLFKDEDLDGQYTTKCIDLLNAQVEVQDKASACWGCQLIPSDPALEGVHKAMSERRNPPPPPTLPKDGEPLHNPQGEPLLSGLQVGDTLVNRDKRRATVYTITKIEDKCVLATSPDGKEVEFDGDKLKNYRAERQVHEEGAALAPQE